MTMNPTQFPLYSAPKDLEEALRQVQLAGTSPLGGGTVLYPSLQRAEVDAQGLTDLFSIPDMHAITATDTTIRVGAMTTYADILNSSNTSIPSLLRTTAGTITGGPQLRNQGTIGGSACYANPASDIPSVLVALHAQLHLSSNERGERSVPASDFFVGPFATSRQDDEVLTAVVLPQDSATEVWGRYKLKHSEGGWPIGVASACLRPDSEGSGGTVTITLGALCETPVELDALRLRDCTTPDRSEQAQIRDLISDADPLWWSDELADASYRNRVAGTVATRAVSGAIAQRMSND